MTRRVEAPLKIVGSMGRSPFCPQIERMDAEFIFVGNRGKDVPEDTRYYLLETGPCILPVYSTLHLKGVCFIIINIVRTTMRIFCITPGCPLPRSMPFSKLFS